MKKIFTLFAVALMGITAYTQESCPSELRLSVLNGEDPSQVEIELQLINSSLYLNGFTVQLNKDNENVQWKNVNGNYLTAEGYANVILARWEGVTDEEREASLSSKCDVYSGVNGFGRLALIELLSTSDCRFFPILEEPTGIGKFYLDMSGCEEGEVCTLYAAPFVPDYFFSYIDPEVGFYNYSNLDPDEYLEIELVKRNGVVVDLSSFYDLFYLVGTFNGWSLEDGMIQFWENMDETQYGCEVELEDGAEFKIITPVANGWKWFGGVDENQVGYFEINDNLLDQPIELVDGSNFKVVGDGKYTITVMQPATSEGRAVAEPLVMTVSKEATGISTISADKADGRIFELQGRELQSVPEHGIYIQNGKKYVK